MDREWLEKFLAEMAEEAEATGDMRFLGEVSRMEAPARQEPAPYWAPRAASSGWADPQDMAKRLHDDPGYEMELFLRNLETGAYAGMMGAHGLRAAHVASQRWPQLARTAHRAYLHRFGKVDPKAVQMIQQFSQLFSRDPLSHAQGRGLAPMMSRAEATQRARAAKYPAPAWSSEAAHDNRQMTHLTMIRAWYDQLMKRRRPPEDE